jgi:ankyrin repeat protein
VQCLVKELGADINHANQDGITALSLAAQEGNLDMLRCLATELGANNVNQASPDGFTPLDTAALKGRLAVVRYLVEELGADVNHAIKDGATPLVAAAYMDHKKIVAFLIKHGADPKASAPAYGTAANVSKICGASDEQTAYLEAKTHCSNPGCSGIGLKKCTGCKQARYCGKECQLAHWPTHKNKCKEAAKDKATAGDQHCL